MRILVVGAGGVGAAIAAIAERREFFDHMVLADVDLARAERAVSRLTEGGRFAAADVDASDAGSVACLAREIHADVVLNACDPRLNPPIFDGAFAAGAHLRRHGDAPLPPAPGAAVRGGRREARRRAVRRSRTQWATRGQLALVGLGVEPGLSDVFARYAADHLFSAIDEVGVRDGANLVIDGYDFAPTFSIWTTIEECLNPPVIWEKDRGWFTTAPFSEPEVFEFPGGIGPVECVNVEHEEVLLVPRWVDCQRVTFKYGLGDEFIAVLEALHKTGLDRTDKIRVRDVEVSPRDVVAASLPNPAELGDRMHGKTCAGTWVTGTGTDGNPREVYLHHIVDNDWSMEEYGHQAVVWQTAINPVIGLELLARGDWSGSGVLGPEAFDAVPYLDLLTEYGSPWGMEERTPA